MKEKIETIVKPFIRNHLLKAEILLLAGTVAGIVIPNVTGRVILVISGIILSVLYILNFVYFLKKDEALTIQEKFITNMTAVLATMIAMGTIMKVFTHNESDKLLNIGLGLALLIVVILLLFYLFPNEMLSVKKVPLIRIVSISIIGIVIFMISIRTEGQRPTFTVPVRTSEPVIQESIPSDTNTVEPQPASEEAPAQPDTLK